MTDPNRKTLRSFYCFDFLWLTYEQISRDFNLPIDHLIYEALRLYEEGLRRGVVPHPAESFQALQMLQSVASGQTGPLSSINPVVAAGQARPMVNGEAAFGFADNLQQFNPSSMSQQTTRQAVLAAFDAGAVPNHPRQHPLQMNSHAGLVQANSGATFDENYDDGFHEYGVSPPPPPPRVSVNSALQSPASFRTAATQPPVGNRQLTGQMVTGNPPISPRQNQSFTPVQPVTGNPIYLYFDNNRYTIGTEDFVIGRGNQRTDLTIRDGNISRRHCAILFRNGNHYIKDLGSTNGVEYQGNRIESKKIVEGDLFYLCDYELRFSYQ